MGSKALRVDNINPNIVEMQYAVRGPLVSRALELASQLAQGTQKPFKRVIFANLGDAHAMGQKPITFVRQVLACCFLPDLLKKPFFPVDVKCRAAALLDCCKGNTVGAYSAGQGMELVRRHVAEYIARRDGHAADWQDICLSNGASSAIKIVLRLLCKSINGLPSGVLIPIPQYPLYSATLAEYGLAQEEYYLDEAQGWALDVAELERAKAEAKSTVRAIVVINPGNPTGQVLTRSNMEEIVQFAHRHALLVLADEVYQHNVHERGCTFHSFKKVVREMGEPYSRGVQLCSFMSVSKGYAGECGLRGGYVELVNLQPAVQAHLYKLTSVALCPNVPGQIALDCIVSPPRESEASHALWLEEETAVSESLKQRAKVCADTFNSMQGFRCNIVQGAMYAFPRLSLSARAVAAAAAAGEAPDHFYCCRLLEETGICVVPGAGFGQRPGTYHFRTTILPQPALLHEMLHVFKQFQINFSKVYKCQLEVAAASMAEPLQEHNMNPRMVRLRHAAGGALAPRAVEIHAELAQGASKPFTRVIHANVGDAQALGQAPVTFIRQVLACCAWPALARGAPLPPDVAQRAAELLAGCSGQSMGAYSVSQGAEGARRRAAQYIARRDGYPAAWRGVCLAAGAGAALAVCLQLLCKDVDGLNSGVMIPTPHRPLYAALLGTLGLGPEEYYLDEAAGWAIDLAELERVKQQANTTVRALLVNNPCNPTGHVLTRRNIEAVIKFAYHHHLLLLADEQYQQNVLADGCKFYSFKKVLCEMGEPYSSGLELASFMSVSKGYAGECGLRGGWMELVNLDPAVQAHLYKLVSAMLCPSVPGQIALDCIARPPQEGEPSYALWLEETTAIMDSLKQRAKLVVDAFNSMAGIECHSVQGAMYAFPRLSLSARAVAAAAAAGEAPDHFYCCRLLEETGICVVPGAGFGQRPGTYHFRTTILPQPALLHEMLHVFKQFHDKFTAEYS